MSKPKLSRAELDQLNKDADELLPKLKEIVATLERIDKLSENLPSEDVLHDLEKSAGNIVYSLTSIPELCDALPTADSLEDLEHRTAAIAANLSEAGE